MSITERYVTSGADGGGDGSSGSPWTLAEAFANAVAGDRVNIKADGTYSPGANLTPSNSGNASQPVIFRGYKTTIGDGYAPRTDGGALITTDMPLLSMGNHRILGGGTANYVLLESLNIESTSNAGGVLDPYGRYYWYVVNCRVYNSANNAGGKGIETCQGTVVMDCDVSAVGASASGFAIQAGTPYIRVIGCRITSQHSDGLYFQQGYQTAIGNVIYDCGGVGINVNVAIGYHTIVNNTIVNCTGAAISQLNQNTDDPSIVACNHITGCAYAFNSAYATGLPYLHVRNRTRDNTSADTGYGDWPNIGAVTTDTGGDETDYEDAASDDYRLIDGAPGEAAGMFGQNDIGAVQSSDLPTPDYPDRENVLSDDTVNGQAGLFANVDASNVVSHVQWGANGNEFTGSFDESARNVDPGIANVKLATAYKIQNVDLVGVFAGGASPPTSPTLEVSVSGTDVTFTISGADVGTTNRVYLRTSSGTWAETPEVTISGNGSASAIIDTGAYFATVTSTSVNNGQSVGTTDPVYFSVVGTSCNPVRSGFGDDFFATDQEYIMQDFWVTADYQQDATIVSGIEVALGDVITEYDDRSGLDIAIGDSSLWVRPCDLTVEPKMHDRITLENGNVFEAMAPGRLDDERCLIRIPTIRVVYNA